MEGCSSVPSREPICRQYEKETRSTAIMGHTISISIALGGVLNFINSMVTAILSRRKEFAVMQSIGMTKKQLRRLLVFEGLYYAPLHDKINGVLKNIIKETSF